MKLTPEQLMIPRVMCIGTEVGKPIWPRSIYRAGEIVIIPNERTKYIFCDTDGPTYYDFPHLFRPIPWYEGRKPEEMPQYLKSTALYKDFHIVEIKNHYIKHFIGLKDGQYWEAPYDEYVPTTEAEYIAYQNSKK